MKQYIKDGVIKTRNNIVIKKNGLQYINPTEAMVLEDGWVEYVPEPVELTPYVKSREEIVEELVTKQWNERTDISNEEALDYMVIVYPWSEFIGKELPVGKIVAHEGKLWRVRQAHTAQDEFAPSMATAALFEVIEKEHSGEADDPIPYNPPMEIFAGKYYSEEGTVYLCTRDSGTALSHSLKDLTNIYVEAV
ncbi:MAG: hypothetical protein IIV19_00810 [Bacteroidaceae bacterium]|nr:hypothetical protein [Bacteroidaceae bacterium]